MSSIESYTANKVCRVLPDGNSSDDSEGINIESDEEEEAETMVKICELVKYVNCIVCVKNVCVLV